MKRLLAIAVLTTLAACQTADVAARQAGVTPDKSTDEAGLWMQSEKAEAELQNAGIRIKDEALNAYVRQITCDVAPDFCDDVRVYLLESSSFNAFMMPNGGMAVFSGLMLRAENEAQLASVIGHEIGHFEENHSLERQRTLKRTAMFALAGDIVTGGLGSVAGILALQGYSRDNEREADAIGFRRLEAAGYSVSEAADVWAQLITEAEASDFKRKRRRANRSSILDSHPAPPERSQTLAAKAAAAAPGGKTEADRYRARIRPFLADWLDADLRARDWGMSLHLINRLKQSNQDLGVLTYFEAEAYRQRRDDGDDILARETYEAAATHSDAPPETWRALGEAYRKSGRAQDAADAYRTYLTKKPAAPDRALIERAIKTLEAS